MKHVIAGLDPAIRTFVTPSEAGVQLAASQHMKLDSGLRRNDDEGVQIHQMHRAFRAGFAPSGMKEGWSVPSRGANVVFNNGARAVALHL